MTVSVRTRRIIAHIDTQIILLPHSTPTNTNLHINYHHRRSLWIHLHTLPRRLNRQCRRRRWSAAGPKGRRRLHHVDRLTTFVLRGCRLARLQIIQTGSGAFGRRTAFPSEVPEVCSRVKRPDKEMEWNRIEPNRIGPRCEKKMDEDQAVMGFN